MNVVFVDVLIEDVVECVFNETQIDDYKQNHSRLGCFMGEGDRRRRNRGANQGVRERQFFFMYKNG